MKVIIDKHFVSGRLAGTTIQETMSHVDWDKAVKWAEGVSNSKDTDYIILRMVDNIDNNEYHYKGILDAGRS